MDPEGERLARLLADARQKVVICAPFLKATAFERVIAPLRADVPLKVHTRWLPEEVASGVSDPEVYDLVSARAHGELRLNDDLHAKLYVADDRCFVGSANITARALGWRTPANVELLAELSVNDADVVRLMDRLRFSRLATAKEKARVEAEAVRLKDSEVVVPSTDYGFDGPWLPNSMSCRHLYEIYANPDVEVGSHSIRSAAYSDLQALSLPAGMPENEFQSCVRSRLEAHPVFGHVTSYLSGAINDTRGEAILREHLPEIDERIVADRWRAIRTWIAYFFDEVGERSSETELYIQKAPPKRTE